MSVGHPVYFYQALFVSIYVIVYISGYVLEVIRDDWIDIYFFRRRRRRIVSPMVMRVPPYTDFINNYMTYKLVFLVFIYLCGYLNHFNGFVPSNVFIFIHNLYCVLSGLWSSIHPMLFSTYIKIYRRRLGRPSFLSKTTEAYRVSNGYASTASTSITTSATGTRGYCEPKY